MVLAPDMGATQYSELIIAAAKKAGRPIARYTPHWDVGQKSDFDLRRGQFRGWLWQAQGGVCGRCDKPMKGMAAATLDHVYPLARQGKNWIGNLLLMHQRCNHHKAAEAPGAALIRRLEWVNSRLEIAHGPKVFNLP